MRFLPFYGIFEILYKKQQLPPDSRP